MQGRELIAISHYNIAQKKWDHDFTDGFLDVITKEILINVQLLVKGFREREAIEATQTNT